jgi:hypothetical protein
MTIALCMSHRINFAFKNVEAAFPAVSAIICDRHMGVRVPD